MAEREDWALFRSVEGLCQKAGVADLCLRRLVLKELADNALDTGADIRCGVVDSEKNLDLFFIEDDGPGLDGTPEEIASLFSIRRPMRSSKLLRLPQRGALGNGLRVVAGAVLASAGSLVVITRNKRIKLRPQADGSTTVVRRHGGEAPARHAHRDRIWSGLAERGRCPVRLGARLLPRSPTMARATTAGPRRSGTTRSQFHELILALWIAAAAQPDRTTSTAAAAAKRERSSPPPGSTRASCERVNRQQATRLLAIARKHARPVSPERLGFVGRDAYAEHYYAIERGLALLRQRRAARRDPVRGRGLGAKDRARRATSDCRACW